MTLRRGFHGRSSPVRAKRITNWGLGPQAIDVEFSATGSQIWSTGAVLTIEAAVTLVRLRGLCSFYQTVADAPGTGFAGAVGIGLVTSQAFAVGVTAVPTPVTEVGWEGWLYHRFFDTRAITATIADGVNAVAVTNQFEIDSKAMRKWTDNFTLMGVVEVVEIGIGTVQMHADTRTLIKLS